MGHPLVVNAVELLRRPGTRKRVEARCSAAEVGIDDPRIEAGADLDVDVELESLTDGIVVVGGIRVPWVGTCRRCLRPAAGTAEFTVDELYQPTPTDPDAFVLVGDQLDLRPMVREAALLDAPANPLCRPDCAGLCPTCGIDRNEGSCSCAAPPADDRWQALEGLRGRLPDRE